MKYRLTVYGWLDIIQTVAVFVLMSILFDGFWHVFLGAMSLFAMLSMAEHKAILRAQGVSDAMIEKKREV